METLTRVMARTVYGIDLQNPPLEKMTQRSKVKRFGRGEIVESASFEGRPQSFARGWGHVQGQSHTRQARSENSAEKKTSTISAQPISKPPLPRSASEPGMQVPRSHVKTQLSDSEISRPIHASLSLRLSRRQVAVINATNLNMELRNGNMDDKLMHLYNEEVEASEGMIHR